MRTEKKLGYVVGSRLAHRLRVPGLMFFIQSPVANGQQLRAEIEGFISAFEASVQGMSEEELQRYRRSVLVNIEEKPKSLGELSGRHQESLQLGFDDFDFRRQLAKHLREVSKDSLLEAFHRLLKDDVRGLWVTTLDGVEQAEPRHAMGVDHGQLKQVSEGSYRYAR